MHLGSPSRSRPPPPATTTITTTNYQQHTNNNNQNNTNNNNKITNSVSKLRSDCAVRDAYKLGRTLGKGGFAVVRLATDRQTGVDWAVKVMALPRQGATPGDNDNTM